MYNNVGLLQTDVIMFIYLQNATTFLATSVFDLADIILTT